MAKCLKCGCSERLEGIRVVTGAESFRDLKVEAYRNPGALVFKGAVSSVLQASICGGCGYTELYAAEPGALSDAVKEAARKADRP